MLITHMKQIAPSVEPPSKAVRARLDKEFRMILIRSVYAFLATALIGIPAAQAGDVTTAAQRRTHQLENPVAALSLERLAATRERPLFTPGRRRPTAPSAVTRIEPPPPPPNPPKLSLFGVLADASGARAVVRADPAGKIQRVRLGDDIGGWRVTQIEGRRLVIALDGHSVTVSMFNNTLGGKQFAQVHPSSGVPKVNAAEAAADASESHRGHGRDR